MGVALKETKSDMNSCKTLSEATRVEETPASCVEKNAPSFMLCKITLCRLTENISTSPTPVRYVTSRLIRRMHISPTRAEIIRRIRVPQKFITCNYLSKLMYHPCPQIDEIHPVAFQGVKSQLFCIQNIKGKVFAGYGRTLEELDAQIND